MRIREMTATFGRLEKATLRPGEGLTLVKAPNEGGKSTWGAFLRAMLYGFPARDRDKAGYIAEKNRYQPWSGAPMEGSLTLEWKGRELTIYRGPKGSTVWGSFSAVWTAGGEPVEGLTAENCGEVLLGISREVFERTAFVGQGGVFLSPSADLEKKIAALATAGEEDVSYSQVERRLMDWRNRRRVNSRVGLIPELERELETVELALDRQGGLLRQAQTAQREKETLEGSRRELQEGLKAHAAAQAAQQARQRARAQADYDEALDTLQRLQRAVERLPSEEELRQAQGELSYANTLSANLRVAEKAVEPARERAEERERQAEEDPYFGGWDPAQAAAKARADCDEVQRLQKKRAAALSLLGAPVGCVLSFVLIRTSQGQPYSLPLLILGALIGWAIVALPMVLTARGRKRRAATLLGGYQAQAPEDILRRGSDYGALCAAAQEARREARQVEAERDRLSEQQETLTRCLLEFAQSFEPGVTSLFGVSSALSKALQQGERCRLAQARLEAAEKVLSALPSPEGGTAAIPDPPPEGDPTELAARLAAVNGALERVSDQAARLRGELASSGDPAELTARRGRLVEELERRRGEYDALTAALESLKRADSLLRERFSPAVNERAGAYLSKLTGGKYDRAALTRQFQGQVREAGSTAPRADLSLSTGTAQQLYLALRLAMCELALPEEEPCPLVLDDVLDPFDDARGALALDCLTQVARQRQVLLFTCHSREERMLEPGQATVVEL